MLSLADAIIEENIDQVTVYLQQGVELNQFDEYGFTPLIEAAIADNIAIAKLLISYGVDVNLPDATGNTALHWAVENNNLSFCRLLLEQGANPNATTFAGQPVLTMPLLRYQQQLKELLYRHGADLDFGQDFINTKLLGHIFELVGMANLIDPSNHFVQIDFEGFFLEFSLGLISNSLAQFQNHFAARKLHSYNNSAQIIIQTLDRATQLIKFHHYRIDINKYQSQINSLLNQNPLVIPVGYEGHAITFIKAGNLLVKCDRREDSRLYDNIVFYHVGEPSNLTSDLLKNLLYEKNTSEFINDILPQILQLQPVTELKVEAQISGNCSWANVEACIPSLFFLLHAKAPDFQEKIARYKSQALNYFQQWREWNKDRTLQFCIQSFRYADSIRNLCKAEILAAILFQRCNHHNPADNERITSILSILTQPQYKHVLQNYIQVYFYESNSPEGKNFAQLLKTYGYNYQ